MEKKMERIDFRDQISRNKRKSFFLLSIIFSIIILLGFLISQIYSPDSFLFIIIFSGIISFCYVFFSYVYSDKIALFSVGAKLADPEKYRDYYRLVEGLTISSGLPMPKLYIMESNQINAFASGRSPEKAVICVTTGALKKLERRELEGVLAHELGHVQNYDIRYMTLVSVAVGMISIISNLFLRSLWFRGNDRDNKNSIFLILGIILAILSPIFIFFVQMAISRKREFSADASSVKFTRYPEGLIRALKKIQQEEKIPEKKVNQAVAPLFFADPLGKMSSTHPPIEERIKVLEKM
jgi:heat shock protein HtpX